MCNGGGEHPLALDIYKITRLQSLGTGISDGLKALDIYKITRLQSLESLEEPLTLALDIYKITRLQSGNERTY